MMTRGSILRALEPTKVGILLGYYYYFNEKTKPTGKTRQAPPKTSIKVIFWPTTLIIIIFFLVDANNFN